MLTYLVEELAKRHAITPEEVDKNHYALNLPDIPPVHLHDLSPGLLLQGEIGYFDPEADQEDLFIHLTKANFLGQGTGGGALGLTPTHSITFSKITLEDLSISQFEDFLEDYLNYLHYWKDHITPKGDE